jgi:signal peptidase I
MFHDMAFLHWSAFMEWKPKRWIAVVLSLFSSPLGLLYVGKARWAIGFFSIVLACGLASSVVPGLAALIYVAWLLSLALPVCMFFVARKVSLAARPWYSRPKGLLAISAAFVIPILLARTFLYEPFRMPSSSMEPTLPRGAMLLAQKAGYGHYSAFGVKLGHGGSAMLAHGDLVVFDFPPDPQVTYVKRVIGLPGDLVKVEGTRVTLNGVPAPNKQLDDSGLVEEELKGVRYKVLAQGASYPYWQERDFASHEQCRSTETSMECRVPDGHYFVLGDNRNNSADSRIWGFVPAGHVVGRVVKVFAPFESQCGANDC